MGAVNDFMFKIAEGVGDFGERNSGVITGALGGALLGPIGLGLGALMGGQYDANHHQAVRREAANAEAQEYANNQNNAINAQRKRIADETSAMKAQSDFRQSQFNKSVARTQRARVRGGLFGDDRGQPAGNLSPRLG